MTVLTASRIFVKSKQAKKYRKYYNDHRASGPDVDNFKEFTEVFKDTFTIEIKRSK